MLHEERCQCPAQLIFLSLATGPHTHKPYIIWAYKFAVCSSQIFFLGVNCSFFATTPTLRGVRLSPLTPPGNLPPGISNLIAFFLVSPFLLPSPLAHLGITTIKIYPQRALHGQFLSLCLQICMPWTKHILFWTTFNSLDLPHLPSHLSLYLGKAILSLQSPSLQEHHPSFLFSAHSTPFSISAATP